VLALIEMIQVDVVDDKMILRFHVRDAEEPEALESLLDSFEDATVEMTKNAAAGQVILSITPKAW
jgi:hypothetical protein